MNVAILHYHLNRGGVTRVIENQLAALDTTLDPADPWQVALIYGGRHEGFNRQLVEQFKGIELSLHAIELLDYDNQRDASGQDLPADLLMALMMVLAERGFAPEQTVVHLHNHSLGKNRLLPEIVPVLAEDGYSLLLQIHDFAEDYRAENFRQLARRTSADEIDPLYPQAANIHYAVLNGRDCSILQEAGIPMERLHLLPNPVPEPADLPDRTAARRLAAERIDVAPDAHFLLYPVRGIRRKNVGEALLYSALAPEGTIVGITLAPLNPVEVPIYSGWKDLAAELKLPFRFEVGEVGRLSFAENLAAADAILSTSLAEGFGMVFLEAWLAGRPLVGRDLPEITADFVRAGLRFDWLRSELRVPLAWVGAENFVRTITEAFRRTREAYGLPRHGDLGQILQEKTRDGLVDFGDLDEAMQRRVIQAVCNNRQHRQRVLDDNPGLEAALAVRADQAADVIDHNRKAVLRSFASAPSGRRLREIYDGIRSSGGESAGPLPHAERILDRFLDFSRFRLIRS